MKLKTNKPNRLFTLPVCLVSCMFLLQATLSAQDSTQVTEEVAAPAKVKPVKNTFESIWIIDNQTVMVPIKGTFEMDIMHRFGTVKNGYSDFWGFFAPSNIRLGFEYVPVKNLMIGASITKANMTWEGYGKYSIIKQIKGKYPVSVTYFGDIAYDTRKDADKSIFKYTSQRISFFNQLIIARKITNKISVQIAPSLTHQNSVNGYYTKNDSTGKEIFKEMQHDHFAIAISGRYKLKEAMAIIVNYDQPITKHNTNNPSPNISFGLELTTSSHAFQFFLGNYGSITPQRNNYFNHNDPHFIGQYLIGFNITRLWNY
jgi:Membrane bound beta barrel domain (DUF5777)